MQEGRFPAELLLGCPRSGGETSPHLRTHTAARLQGQVPTAELVWEAGRPGCSFPGTRCFGWGNSKGKPGGLRQHDASTSHPAWTIRVRGLQRLPILPLIPPSGSCFRSLGVEVPDVLRRICLSELPFPFPQSEERIPSLRTLVRDEMLCQLVRKARAFPNGEITNSGPTLPWHKRNRLDTGPAHSEAVLGSARRPPSAAPPFVWPRPLPCVQMFPLVFHISVCLEAIGCAFFGWW